MKKMTKRIVTLLMAVLLISAFALPVMAANRYERELVVGETTSLQLTDTPYVSSNPDVVRVDYDGGYKYTAVAVGKGTATLTGATWMGAKGAEYDITVYSSELAYGFGSMGAIGIVVIGIWVVVLGLLIGSVVYIFIAAPKCGMSRWWAVLPLFSSVVGVLVFIVVRSTRKTQTSAVNTFRCPTCSAVHPYGTATCSICGRKFYE